MVTQIAIVLNVTESCTLKWLIVCYLNFTSIKENPSITSMVLTFIIVQHITEQRCIFKNNGVVHSH